MKVIIVERMNYSNKTLMLYCNGFHLGTKILTLYKQIDSVNRITIYSKDISLIESVTICDYKN